MKYEITTTVETGRDGEGHSLQRPNNQIDRRNGTAPNDSQQLPSEQRRWRDGGRAGPLWISAEMARELAELLYKNRNKQTWRGTVLNLVPPLDEGS